MVVYVSMERWCWAVCRCQMSQWTFWRPQAARNRSVHVRTLNSPRLLSFSNTTALLTHVIRLDGRSARRWLVVFRVLRSRQRAEDAWFHTMSWRLESQNPHITLTSAALLQTNLISHSSFSERDVSSFSLGLHNLSQLRSRDVIQLLRDPRLGLQLDLVRWTVRRQTLHPSRWCARICLYSFGGTQSDCWTNLPRTNNIRTRYCAQHGYSRAARASDGRSYPYQ